MKLTFKGPYQSISSFTETELSEFAVITGLNGSGKTHLLNAINNGNISIDGINADEIILYNYDDFTIQNATAQDMQVQQRKSIYDNKSTAFQQRVYLERQQALESFDLDSKDRDERYTSLSFPMIQNFSVNLNWSDSDFDLFEEKVRASNPNDELQIIIDQLNPYQLMPFQILGYDKKITDVKQYIADIREFKLEQQALALIRASNYAKAFLTWESTELEALSANYAAGTDQNVLQQILSGLHINTMSVSLRTFLQTIQMNPQIITDPTIEKLIKLRDIALPLIDDVKKHFLKVIRPQTLQMLGDIDSNNLMAPIMIESGFLNLHVIKESERQYQIEKLRNNHEKFKLSENLASNYLSEEEFCKMHGESPVDSLNLVLNEYDCNGYEFKQSQINYTFGTDLTHHDITISLYNKAGNYDTSLDALSSGERTLLALAFTIYKLKRKKVIAKLFLMDEIDSALHPSMAQRLLNVLYKLFHKEMNINMIISTHSPSTVAFAPDNCIFVMRRGLEPRLIPTSKSEALRELTSGVPSFSINYENRRQVFVESSYDVKFYESLYNIYRKKLHAEISLNFIASGSSEANGNGVGINNCEQVIKITTILRTAGNKFIWGIIDWDLNNRPAYEGVKVLGNNKRYSIENYLLDPLLVAILLLREKFEEPAFFGLPEDTSYLDLSKFNIEDFQKMVDSVLNKLTLPTNDHISTHSYQLVNGISLLLPVSFTRCQGHLLEEMYLKAFPKLNAIRRREPELKRAILNKVISESPALAPVDLIDILREVQEID